MTIDLAAPIPGRPYASRASEKAETSVTTILDVKHTPGLDWAAAKLTAEYAVLEDTWKVDSGGAILSPPEQIDALRRYFRGIWDGRAYMGTMTHAMLEAWIQHETADLHALVDTHQPWQKIHDEKVEQAMGYVNGLAAWWDRYEPADCLTEQVVRSPGLYIGTRDLVCTIEGERWLLDLKTTEQKWNDDKPPKDQKGVYGDSWTLQLAAYRYAREVITYRWAEGKYANGKPRAILEVDTVTLNEPVDRCGIVHLRGDNRFTFYEVDADAYAYDLFLGLIPLAQWLKDLPTPTIIEQGA